MNKIISYIFTNKNNSMKEYHIHSFTSFTKEWDITIQPSMFNVCKKKKTWAFTTSSSTLDHQHIISLIRLSRLSTITMRTIYTLCYQTPQILLDVAKGLIVRLFLRILSLFGFHQSLLLLLPNNCRVLKIVRQRGPP